MEQFTEGVSTSDLMSAFQLIPYQSAEDAVLRHWGGRVIEERLN